MVPVLDRDASTPERRTRLPAPAFSMSTVYLNRQSLTSPCGLAARCTRRGLKETHLDSSSMIPSTVAKTISSSSSSE